MPPSKRSGKTGLGEGLAVAGAGALMVLCCAVAPLLVAGGVTGVVGGLLRSPWVIGLGVLLTATAVVYALARRTRSDHACDECCNPRTPEDGSPEL